MTDKMIFSRTIKIFMERVRKKEFSSAILLINTQDWPVQQRCAAKDVSRIHSFVSLTNKEMQKRNSAHRNIDT